MTPSQLKRLGRQRQLAYMRAWFEHLYEDPTNETPRDEGEFIYPWGGPYDAIEELEAEFGSIISFERIEELAKDLEGDGITDWAPTSNHPDQHEARYGGDDDDPDGDADEEEPPDFDNIIKRVLAGATPRYGDPYEQKTREDLYGRVVKLEDEVRRRFPARRGIGDNNPPPDDEGVPTDETQLASVASAAADLKQELEKSDPDALIAATAASRLSKAGKWLKDRFDKASEKVVEGAMLAGYGLATNDHVWKLVHHVAVAAGHWFGAVLSKF